LKERSQKKKSSPLQTTFPKLVVFIESGIVHLYINALKCENKEQIEEVRIKVEDEMLSQLFVHTIDNILAKVFMNKLAEGETYHN
jgi:hypothetical protein